MKLFFSKLPAYIGIGVLAIPFTIVTHELGHYFAYCYFGASNVVLHSVSVSANKDALSSWHIAIASIVGPLISYLTIGLAVFFTRKNYVPFWIIIGLAAPIGRIVNFVYVYFRVLGFNPNPNFDEFNFSQSLGIEPMVPSVITIIASLAIWAYFLRRVWTAGRFAEIAIVALSLVVGLLAWSFVGASLLP